MPNECARLESDADGRYCYFATIYVAPAARRQGVATALLDWVEAWARAHGLAKIVYNTAEDNARLIGLFADHGYRVTHCENEMVQLTCRLSV